MPDGYLIVRRTDVYVNEYERRFTEGDWARYAGFYRELRAKMPFVDPRAYGGIGRAPLMGLPPEMDSAVLNPAGTNRDAERRLWTLEHTEDGMLTSLAHAREVRALTDSPDEWEIIRVSTSPERTSMTFGYDVGWWLNYSIVDDTFVCPMWHPPQPEDFKEVAARSRRLNEHVLFETLDDVHDFVSWYATKEWAEDWEQKFIAIRVDGV